MSGVLDDLRFAVRILWKAPLVAATIVLCLGFSVGATGTVYNWTRSLVGAPVPGVDDVEGLVSLRTVTQRGDAVLSYPTVVDVRDAVREASPPVLTSVAAFSLRRFAVRLGDNPDPRSAEPIWGSFTTANYFDALGVRPLLGRTFRPDEGRIGGAADVVVVSHAFWQRRLAGGDVIGQRLSVNNHSVTIVGVAPPSFHGTITRLGLDLWMPLALQPAISGGSTLLEQRDTRWLDTFGRLAPGASLATADAAMQSLGERLAAEHVAQRELGMRARRLDVGPVEQTASIFVVLLGLSLLVVLIVCSNVANLLLLRGTAREHEIAVRLALGAPSGRVVRQLMTECLVLALAGVAVAVAFTALTRNALGSLAPATPLPLMIETPFDPAALALIAGVGVSTIFAFGLVPALRSTRVAVRASLHGGVRGGTSRGSRLRGALVSAQFALSLAVLATAGLFIKRLDDLRQVDRGFRDPAQVLLATVDFELAGLRDTDETLDLVDRLVREVAALPGVEHATAATFVPLGFLGYRSAHVDVAGHAPRPGESTTFLINSVAPGYFETMGIPIVDGRPIDAGDRAEARPVVVVNEAFARRFWGDGSSIGRRLVIRDVDVTVVGVAANGKYEFLVPLDDPSPPFIYLPFAQWPDNVVVLHARVSGAPLRLVPSLRRAVERVDARLSASSPSTLESYSSVPYLPIQLASAVLTALGLAALALATLGLYAVIAFAVVQQQRDIGIRMALGASARRVVTHFVTSAATYAMVGAAVGGLMAFAIARTLANRLPGSVPDGLGGQLLPFGMAILLLGLVAVVAAVVPARGAARVDPTVALREE